MDKLFESISEDEDYEKVAEKILYQENKEEIEKLYSEEEFLKLDHSTKNKIFSELKLNFKFVFTFGTSITALYPIVESFIINSGIDQIHIDKSTIVYLTIASIAIVLDRPKETYKKLFSELRLRNVYGFLENLTIFFSKMKDLFNYICSMIGKVSYDIIGMFNYTILFVPFALTLASILSLNQIDLPGIIDAISHDGFMKFTTVSIGVTGITMREMVTDLIKKLKDFKFSDFKKYLSRSFSKIQSKVNSFINKVKDLLITKDIDKDIKSKEVIDSKEKEILKWDQWKKTNGMNKDIEQINDSIS